MVDRLLLQALNSSAVMSCFALSLALDYHFLEPLLDITDELPTKLTRQVEK